MKLDEDPLRHGRENSLLRSGGCQKTSRWALDRRFKCGTCCSRRGTSCRSCCCCCRSCQSHCRCISIRFQMLENTSEKQKSQLSNEIKKQLRERECQNLIGGSFFSKQKNWSAFASTGSASTSARGASNARARVRSPVWSVQGLFNKSCKTELKVFFPN